MTVSAEGGKMRPYVPAPGRLLPTLRAQSVCANRIGEGTLERDSYAGASSAARDMSSRVRPFVSWTKRRTKKKATTPKAA
jgi:hypothetical protein